MASIKPTSPTAHNAPRLGHQENATLAPLAAEVLIFWFGDDVESPAAIRAAAPRWFRSDAAFDLQIRARFGNAVEAAARGAHDDWTATPRGTLALLILLDQFSRNLYRQDPRAFAADRKAQAIALAAIEQHGDRVLAPVERVFMYMPLEHAESLALQDRSVALFEQLRADAPSDLGDLFDDYAHYAKLHRDWIARFGRFPHRNAVLGRASSEEEKKFLAENDTPG